MIEEMFIRITKIINIKIIVFFIINNIEEKI